MTDGPLLTIDFGTAHATAIGLAAIAALVVIAAGGRTPLLSSVAIGGGDRMVAQGGWPGTASLGICW
jgi:hypothetical protein